MFTVPSREQLKFLRHLISYYDHDPVHDKLVDLTANKDYFEPQVTNYKSAFVHCYTIIIIAHRVAQMRLLMSCCRLLHLLSMKVANQFLKSWRNWYLIHWHLHINIVNMYNPYNYSPYTVIWTEKLHSIPAIDTHTSGRSKSRKLLL